MPMAAKKTRPTEPTAAENRGLRNSRTSSDGWSMRRSYATNAARTATPATIGPPAPRAGSEAVLAAVDDAVDERDQAGDGQQHAEQVDPARAAGRATRAPAR